MRRCAVVLGGLLWQDQVDEQASDTAAALWSPVQVLEHLAQREGGEGDTPASDAPPPGTSADELYSQLVQLGLLRR